MPRFLDVEQWSRRAAFEFFRGYDHPYFNVCVSLDAGPLAAVARASPDVSFSVSCLYLALRAANEYEPFRYRLADRRVLVHDTIHAGTTALLEDDELAFMYIDYDEEFATFQAGAKRARAALTHGAPRIEARDERSDLIHFTALPWLAFTSITHARRRHPEDGVPKIAFGRYQEAAGRVAIPVSVEVHHALLDGLHVARYFERLQQYLISPEQVLGTAPTAEQARGVVTPLAADAP